MATQALVTMNPQQRELADVVKSTVYGGGNLTDAEMSIYLAECERIGVHPLSKGAHIWKDSKGRVGLAVSVHTLTALAERDHNASIVDYEWEIEAATGKIISCTCIGEIWDERTSAWKLRRSTIHREDVSWLFDKDNWRNQPRTMWENRARAKWCRVHRADVCGPLYSSEEVEDIRSVDVQTPFGRENVLINVRSTDVLDAKLLEPAASQVVPPQSTTPRPEDVQAAKKARWAALSAALNASPADLKADVKAACTNLGIAQSAETWTDTEAVAIEAAVRAMRREPAREPGDDGDNPHAKPGGGEYARD